MPVDTRWEALSLQATTLALQLPRCANTELRTMSVSELQAFQNGLQRLFDTTRNCLPVVQHALDIAIPAEYARRRVRMASLPTEILGLIFTAGQTSPSEAITPSFTLLVSAVSRRWRSIALADPSLWTSVRVTLQTSLSDISTRLARSARSPLDIEFNCKDVRFCDVASWYQPTREPKELPDSLADLIRPIMEMLLFHTRLRCLRIVTDTPHALRFICQILAETACPNLEEIALAVGTVSYYPISGDILQGGAPKLALLHLRNIGLSQPWRPLNGLKRLQFSNVLSAAMPIPLSALVAVSPALEHISMIKSELVVSAMELPRLRSLSIRGYPYHSIADICLALVTPSLEALTISGATFPRRRDFVKLVQDEATGNSRYPLLRSLRLSGIVIRDHIGADFLGAIPLLTTLIIHNQQDNRRIAQANPFIALMRSDARGVPSRSSPMLPQLHTLLLGQGTYTLPVLNGMIDNRRIIGRPIVNVLLNADAGPSLEP
ncbi:hypothetical protein PLICRDRAFT_91370 [Plicaturopsis crispa FD-325 SS-3]|nr:hypothetical protein PLICRDRAFT_91370 [Plicaturopsis crispa FD-325 SS-3]